jgi:hypothetical protein
MSQKTATIRSPTAVSRRILARSPSESFAGSILGSTRRTNYLKSRSFHILPIRFFPSIALLDDALQVRGPREQLSGAQAENARGGSAGAAECYAADRRFLRSADSQSPNQDDESKMMKASSAEAGREVGRAMVRRCDDITALPRIPPAYEHNGSGAASRSPRERDASQVGTPEISPANWNHVMSAAIAGGDD